MGRIENRRPGGLSMRGRLAGRLATIGAVLVLATGCAGPAPTVPPIASSTPLPSSLAQASPASTPGASSQPEDNGTWTAVQPTAIARSATLVPTRTGGASVARTTGFLLTSLEGRSALDLAARVVADPPVEFAIAASGASGAILQPKAVLAPATRYSLSLTRADGTVEASWTARTAGPLHITDSVPGDRATEVPLDTGIEFTFDQPGVTAASIAKYFSISPSTTGHFEAKGRSVAFVPGIPLRKATLYTVTVRHGLPLAGTGEVLPKDVVVRFETEAARKSGARVWFADALADATPRERATLTVRMDVPEGAAAPKAVPVKAHRLAGLDSAIAAWTAIAKSPSWTVSSTDEAVPTASLPGVLSASVRVQTTREGNPWILLPRSLPVGWYVVTMAFAGVPRQLVLQITDTATYVLATTTRTAVWANDLRSGKPAAGATASLAGTALAGATNGRGLLLAATPSRVVAGDVLTPLLLVRYHGAVTFRPIASDRLCGDCGGKGAVVGETATDHWWSFLTTDRTEYRQTDTINVAGVAKHRVSGSVPDAVRLLVFRNQGDGEATPILTRTAKPDARGMYTASLQLEDLPTGDYWVRAMVGTEQTGESWFSVATIRKPAYAITVTPDRHAVISGRTVRTTVGAAFFEGTPVAGVSVALTVNEASGETTATTDTSGQGVASLRPVIDDDQVQYLSISAGPKLPEEGSIVGTAPIAVFAGNAFVTLDGVVNTKTVSVTGAVNAVAWDRFEQAGADLYTIDPRGAPRAAASVRINVVAHYTVRRQTGTEYDFITKRVVPKYEYVERELALSARTVRTGTDGRFHVVVATTHDAYAYEVTATYTDEAGRQVKTVSWISSPLGSRPYQSLWLEAIDGHADDSRYAVGDAIGIRLNAGGPTNGDARYLFVTLQQGLKAADVVGSPVFRTKFTAASVPDIQIAAVRFNGSGFDEASYPYTAAIDPRERTLTLALSTDKVRYQPGDTATVSIRTLDRNGKPVAASVFVRAIDEKLYAMGAANEDDPVPQLYQNVPDGVIGSARSHQTPQQESGGGRGDASGGGGSGGRTDFRDWLIAKLVTTDGNGRATVTIPLADDLTSWRVAATAVDARLEAGAASVKVPVGLPFFVDAVIAPQYLVSDRPVLRVRSYGTSIQPGTRVTFLLSSDTLPMAGTTVTADAFGSAYVPIPALSTGTHRIRIAGSARVDGETLTDTMTRTFTVVASRATQLRTTWSPLTGTAAVRTGTGMTRVLLVDAGRGRVVPALEGLAAPGGTRADLELASALANRVLVGQFGLPSIATPDPNGLDVYRINDGLAIVSWGSPELDVTALAAMADDPRLESAGIDSLLRTVATSSDESRARRLLALAGLAALGEPVEDQIAAAAAETDLTVEEQVNLALAALESGDEGLAGRLEQQILAAHGLRFGSQVRIDPVGAADDTVITARLAIVAASLGDPVSGEMDAYVTEHPSPTTLVVLERALAARGWAARVPGTTGSAAITVAGVRHVVDFAAGQGATYELTPAQARSASIEPVTGSVLAVQTWDGALDASSLKPRQGVTITRVVTPAGKIAADGTVIVELHVTLPLAERDAGWQVVENVPSGLVPIPYYGRFPDEATPVDVVSPTYMDGQRVEFLVGWDPKRTDYTLRYVARVVTTGSYTWEPTVLQSVGDPAWGVTVAPATLTILTPGS